MRQFKVSVIGGAGYVGLITALGLAELGHKVVAADVDNHRIANLKLGVTPFEEDGIHEYLSRATSSGALCFTTNLKEAIYATDIVFIAVGTPSESNGQADLSQIIEVTEQIAAHINKYKVIVVKSTVPVGTVELVLNILSQTKKEGNEFDIVSNPEFLREGNGLHDFFNPDRIVVGASADQALKTMRALYNPLIRPSNRPLSHSSIEKVPVVETDIRSAQMIKYASNAFLATRISFINEIAGLCEKVNADIKEVILGMGYDPRIGHDYLQAGLGFGGPCLEKDLRALIKMSEGNNYDPRILRTVLERNNLQISEVIVKLKTLVGKILYRKRITVFGLTFKHGTNDIRNSLSMRVVDRLEQEGAVISAYDPLAISQARSVKPTLECNDDPYEAVRDSCALMILTDWPSFRQLDYERIRDLMASPNLIDSRNLLDASAIRNIGMSYVGVGKI